MYVLKCNKHNSSLNFAPDLMSVVVAVAIVVIVVVVIVAAIDIATKRVYENT